MEKKDNDEILSGAKEPTEQQPLHNEEEQALPETEVFIELKQEQTTQSVSSNEAELKQEIPQQPNLQAQFWQPNPQQFNFQTNPQQQFQNINQNYGQQPGEYPFVVQDINKRKLKFNYIVALILMIISCIRMLSALETFEIIGQFSTIGNIADTLISLLAIEAIFLLVLGGLSIAFFILVSNSKKFYNKTNDLSVFNSTKILGLILAIALSVFVVIEFAALGALAILYEELGVTGIDTSTATSSVLWAIAMTVFAWLMFAKTVQIFKAVKNRQTQQSFINN